MKKAKKILSLLLCALLLVGASVAGTMAYLQQNTGVVQNTFTVGKVILGTETNATDGLDEADVDEYGRKLNTDKEVWEEGEDLAARVTENTYKLIPGHKYTKDPIIHVAAGSEDCYLFVKVVNQIAAIEATGNTTIAAQMEAKGWEVLDATNGIYYYENIVTRNATDNTNVPVFGEFTIATNADVSGYTGKKIEVTAYAVQADGFANATAAWNATFGAQP